MGIHMQPEQIIGQLLGALVGRKRSRRSGILGMALGGGSRAARGSSLLTGGTLLTAAGLVWGALESMQKSTVASSGAGDAATAGGSPAPRGIMTTPPPVPPPLPGTPAAAQGSSVVPPPLPASGTAPVQDAATLLPLVQVAIAAARADGELSAEERAAIHEHAASVGLAADVDRAMAERPSLDTVTSAFTTDDQRQAAYALAYAVIHGDGEVSPGERMHLTQLARLLRLSHDDIAIIERDALGKE